MTDFRQPTGLAPCDVRQWDLIEGPVPDAHRIDFPGDYGSEAWAVSVGGEMWASGYLGRIWARAESCSDVEGRIIFRTRALRKLHTTKRHALRSKVESTRLTALPPMTAENGVFYRMYAHLWLMPWRQLVVTHEEVLVQTKDQARAYPCHTGWSIQLEPKDDADVGATRASSRLARDLRNAILQGADVYLRARIDFHVALIERGV